MTARSRWRLRPPPAVEEEAGWRESQSAVSSCSTASSARDQAGYVSMDVPFLSATMDRGKDYFLTTNQGVPHISLVFREMWDSTGLRFNSFEGVRAGHQGSRFPHLAKNERDMGHPLVRGQDRVWTGGCCQQQARAIRIATLLMLSPWVYV